jgi:hypothetical protein
MTRWWQSGLIGGVTLSLVTAIKVVRAIIRGTAGDGEWSEAVFFALAIFGMGFLCGVIAWFGRGLYNRLGMLGDALVGMVVMVVFFLSCMTLFDPEMLGAKGIPMIGLAVVFGLIGGAWMGRDLRRESMTPAERYRQSHKQRPSDDSENPFDS